MDWLLGINRSKLPTGTTFSFEFGAPPAGTGGLFAILVLVGIAAAIWWIYRRECAGRISRPLAAALLVARLLVLALLAFALTEPRLAAGSSRIVEARTLVLVDESLSLTVQDRYADPERREAVAGLLGVSAADVAQRDRAAVLAAVLARTRAAAPDGQVGEPATTTLLERLATENDVHVYAYGNRPRLLARQDGLRELRVPARADATDLAAAMRAALDEAGGETVAAIVVIGDGRNNTGEDPASVALELLAPRKIPLYSVLIGDDAPPKNIRVQELLAPDRVFASDPILFEIAIEARGFERLATTVELLRTAPDGSGEKLIASRELSFSEGEPVARLTIPATNEETGQFLFVARVPAQEGEITPADNLRSVSVEVIDDKTKVLLVAGGPSFDYRYVKELLRRENTVDLSVWLQSADKSFPQEGNSPIKELPFTDEGLADYDVVMLFDMDPIELASDRIAALRKFVEHVGGGLAFICGEKFALSLLTDSANRELVEMLPIIPDRDRARDFVGFGRQHTTSWRLTMTPEGLDHPITRFATDTHTNQKIWDRLPGVYWHLPVERARPGAKVLLRHSNPEAEGHDGLEPIMVTHFFGPGRTLFLASDETYHWRTVAPKQFSRFWLQAVRYLIQGKLLGGKDQVTIQPDAERVALGGSVGIDAQLRGPDRQPIETPAVTAEVRGGDGETRQLELLAVPGRPGSYSAVLVPWALGPIRLSLELPGDGELARGEATIQVTAPERELADSRADPSAMRALADTTGGQMLLPEQADTLSELIPTQRRQITQPGDPIELWDAPLFAFLLLLTLSFEWILRKRRNLL